jgi:diadenosine tetraphosphate (Ap4A) HIT family hydrolase
MNPCEICAEIAGEPEGDAYHRLLADDRYVHRLILGGGEFGVLPSLGPLVPGHVLMCPVRHLRRFADLPIDLVEQFPAYVEDVIAVLESVYSCPVTRFEHGTSGDGSRIPCTVEHAHVHLLPLPAGASPILPDLGWATVPGGLRELRDYVGPYEYLTWEHPDGHRLVLRGDDAGAIPSQLLRRVVADAVGLPEWNWRVNPDAAAADATFRCLAGELAITTGYLAAN